MAAKGITTVLALLLFALGAARAQSCSDKAAHMSCNVPSACWAYVGSPQYVGDKSDCICLKLCYAAWRQGQGSWCRISPGTSGEFWVRAVFDRWDGNNWYRGTVFCDPKGGGGNGRAARQVPASELSASSGAGAAAGNSTSTSASTQACSGKAMRMFCDVPSVCRAHLGSRKYAGDASDCTCLALCDAARAQGQGSLCDVIPGATAGEFRVRAIFDRADGNNRHRGAVFCDPKAGGGDGDQAPSSPASSVQDSPAPELNGTATSQAGP